MPLGEWNVPFVEIEGAKKVTVKTSKAFQKMRGGRKGKMEAGGRFVRGRFILDPNKLKLTNQNVSEVKKDYTVAQRIVGLLGTLNVHGKRVIPHIRVIQRVCHQLATVTRGKMIE